jgi:hypothetical protein
MWNSPSAPQFCTLPDDGVSATTTATSTTEMKKWKLNDAKLIQTYHAESKRRRGKSGR